MFTSLKELFNANHESILVILRTSESAHDFLEKIRKSDHNYINLAIYFLDEAVVATQDQTFTNMRPIEGTYFSCSFASENLGVEPSENVHIVGLSMLAKLLDNYEVLLYESTEKQLILESLQPGLKPIKFSFGMDSFRKSSYTLEPLRLAAGLAPWTKRSLRLNYNTSSNLVRNESIELSHLLASDFSNYLRILNDYQVTYTSNHEGKNGIQDANFKTIISELSKLPLLKEGINSDEIQIKI